MRRAPCVAFFCDAFCRPRCSPRISTASELCMFPSRNNLNSCGFLVSGPDRNGSECTFVKIEIATVHLHRTPGDMLALISTHAWLHVAAARTRGCMPGRSTARDSCNPRPQWSSLGPRWTAATRASDRQLCTPGPPDGCTPRLRCMPAPRARDACLHPAPAINEASARHGRLQPGPAMDSCNPGPRFTAQPGPAIDGCTPRLRWMAATRARDRRIQRLPRARCAWAEQQTAHISSHDDHARYDSRSCMLCKDRGLGTIRRAERSAAPGHAAKRATATPAPARCASPWCRICMD